MQAPEGQNQPAWWLKYGSRGVGSVGGVIAIGLGLFACITFTAMCLVAGIFQMMAGFIVVAGEAPFCCMFIDFVDRYSKWVEARPPLQKAILYVVISLPPFFMCFSVSVFFGSGLIFLCGVMYGLMAVGKKASRSEMMANANPGTIGGSTFGNMKSTLVDSEAPPATS